MWKQDVCFWYAEQGRLQPPPRLASASHHRPAGRLDTSCLNTPSGYYLSRHWRQRRQQRLEIDGHQCQGCGINAAQLEELSWPGLQVHHKNAGPPNYTYPSFGNEQMSDLLTLCPDCHDGITNSVRRQRFKLDPKKQVNPVHLQPPSLSASIPTRRQHVEPSFCSDQTSGREPTAVPQRANSRSAKYLREGNESRERQAKKD